MKHRCVALVNGYNNIEQMKKEKTLKETKVFENKGTFKALWAAEGWLKSNGYSYGSTCVPYKEVAIVRGEYNLPQKWKNMDKEQRRSVDGVMVSNDYREGPVIVQLFEQCPIELPNDERIVETDAQ